MGTQRWWTLGRRHDDCCILSALWRHGCDRCAAAEDDDAKRTGIKAHTLAQAALTVPMMCNLGTQEGVTVKDGRFAGVWPANQSFFGQVRGKVVDRYRVDPLTAHECGNQRYLAIRWLDACLSARLPEQGHSELRAMLVRTLGLPTSTPRPRCQREISRAMY